MFNRLIAATAAFMAFAGVATAQSTAPDWRLYGFTTSAKPQMAVFYLFSEIVRSPPGHVQVWMKGLDYPKLDKFTNSLDKDSDVVEKAAAKAARAYAPPFTSVKKLTPDEVVSIRVFEQVADEGSIPPTLRALYEFDCGPKLYRELSVIALGETNDEVQPWKHLPPESILETLSKLVCP